MRGGAAGAGDLRHVRGQRTVHAALRAARLRQGAAQRLPAPRAGAADQPRRCPLLPDDPVQPGAVGHHLPGLPRRPRRPAGAVRPRRPARRRAGRQAAPLLDPARPDAAGRLRARQRRPRRRPRGALDLAGGAVAAPGGAQPDPQGVAGDPRRPDRGRRPHGLRHRQAALRQPPDDGGRPRHRLRGRQLLQLAEDPRRRAQPGAAEPEGGRRPARRRHRRLLRRGAAALGGADRRTRRGPDPLAGRARALLRDELPRHRGPDRPRPVLADVRHLRPGRVRQRADGPRGRRRPLRPRRARQRRRPTGSPGGSPSWSRRGRCPTAAAATASPTCTARAASTSTWTPPPAPASRSATSPACASTSPPAPRTTPCSPPASPTSSTSRRPCRPTRRRWWT